MLSREKRIQLLGQLGAYILSEDEQWKEVQYRAVAANAWFTPEHISLSLQNIANEYLDVAKLTAWLAQYPEPDTIVKVGIVMAGNIPLVGFHDFLCGFVSGHEVQIKLSSKDEVLLKHLVAVMAGWEPAVAGQVKIADNLKGCDAYIATGSNNTARYFEQYFAKYPHIIRRNRTSIAILDGTETNEELKALAHDVFSYFGLGCRNITQVCVPEGYDFVPMIDAMSIYEDIINHNKYKNNYDYYLAIYLLNRVPYLSNDSVLLVENKLPFSAVAVLHYRYYNDKAALAAELTQSDDIQSISGHGFKPFGTSQVPALDDYADGVDTMAFLTGLVR